jgi:hypothetical protein
MHAAGIPQHEWTEDRLRRGELDRAALLRATLTDLLVLARARALVGHFASNLSRLAFSLAACAPRAPRPAPRAPRPAPRAPRAPAPAAPHHETELYLGGPQGPLGRPHAVCERGRRVVLPLADVLRGGRGRALPHVLLAARRHHTMG